VILRATVFRAHHPRWSFDSLSGEGARIHGGRFNAKGTAALYTALRQETAWLEAQQGFPFKAQPMTVVGYKVDCADIVDLTNDAERYRLGIDLSELACPWEDLALKRQEPPSWALANRLVKAGAAGIIAPSFASGAGPNDRCVIFWRWNDTTDHRIAVIDDHDRLPRDDSSWR
jgi:RES domain-containing protein